jgi:hypothetical protein
MDSCSYATLHLARFDGLKTMRNIDVKPTSGEPVAWMVGGDEIAAGTKVGSQEASSWVAFGLHSEEESARVLVDAGVAAVPCLEEAAEIWSAVLQPFGHRGEVNWLDHESPGQAFSIDGEGRNRDPFVVVTSVGWTIDDRFDPSRAADFAAGSELVRRSMSSADGLHSRQIFNFPNFAEDTVTITFWRDDAAMRAFAYRAGEHKVQVDRYRKLGTADRTSFTRFRVLESHGSWNGSDPLAW